MIKGSREQKNMAKQLTARTLTMRKKTRDHVDDDDDAVQRNSNFFLRCNPSLLFIVCSIKIILAYWVNGQFKMKLWWKLRRNMDSSNQVDHDVTSKIWRRRKKTRTPIAMEQNESHKQKTTTQQPTTRLKPNIVCVLFQCCMLWIMSKYICIYKNGNKNKMSL